MRCISAIWPAGPPNDDAADLEPDLEGLAEGRRGCGAAMCVFCCRRHRHAALAGQL